MRELIKDNVISKEEAREMRKITKTLLTNNEIRAVIRKGIEKGDLDEELRKTNKEAEKKLATMRVEEKYK